MVYSTMRIYDDLSGTKTVVIRVFGDQEPLEGRDYTAGNNTSFMLTQGDVLEDKLQEFCALDEVRINVSMGKTNKDSTYITMIFDFESIEDYNAKAKTIAGKYADEWTDATLTETGDRVTVREAAKRRLFFSSKVYFTFKAGKKSPLSSVEVWAELLSS